MLHSKRPEPGAAIPTGGELDQLYKKVAWRLLPFLLIAYGVAYLDRINVSFAQVAMTRGLGFTNSIYGFGAGIFFIGYMIFELPSNYLLTKIGERRLIGGIMVAWGLISCAMAGMQGPLSFYALRFLLGVAEAGFAPAFILYVTRWFPQHFQGRIMGLLMSGPFLAGIVGGPISGLILEHMEGVGGLGGWQWMYFLEGLAPVALGLTAFRIMADGPASAAWLTASERSAIAVDRAAASVGRQPTRFVAAFRNPVVHLLSLSYFCLAFAGYALTFWVPALIKNAGVNSVATIGFLSALPATVAVVSMVACGFLADRTGRRVRYIAIAALVAAAGLALIPMSSGNIWLAMVVLCVCKGATNAANAMLWALPNIYLRGPEAAGGVAIIVTVGVLGGFLSPIMVGRIRDTTGRFDAGFYVIAALTLLSCLLVPLAARAASRRAIVR